MIKQYTLQDTQTDQEVTIVVDYEKLDPKLWEELSSFWSEHDERSDDYEAGMLKMIAETALEVQVSHNYNTLGVISWFEKVEGWCKMDGSLGIMITNVDTLDFECVQCSNPIELKEMPQLPKGNF